MIVASCCPHGRSGWLGLVIADRSPGGALRLIDRWGDEVGRLVNLATPIPRAFGPPQDKIRELTPDDAARLAADVMRLLSACGAERLLIRSTPEEFGGEAAKRSRAMIEALTIEATLAGIAVKVVDRVARGNLSAIAGWPEGPKATAETEREAARLLLAREDWDDGVQSDRDNNRGDVASDQDLRRDGGICAEGDRNDRPRLTEEETEVVCPPRDAQPLERAESAAAAVEPSPPPKLGYRIATIDAGTRRINIGISEGTARPLRLVGFESLDTEKIRKIASKDDSPRMSVDADRDAAVEWAVDVLQRYEVDEVLVELPRSIHVVRGNIAKLGAEQLRSMLKAGQARASEVLRMSLAAEAIQRTARMAGIRVLESVPEVTWSAVVGGRKRDGALGSVRERKRAAVKDAERGFVNWPDVEGDRRDDMRDVGGMALYVVDTYYKPKAEKAARAQRAPGVSKPRAEKRREAAKRIGDRRKTERAAVRAALVASGECIGCAGKHRVGCPSHVPLVHGLPR